MPIVHDELSSYKKDTKELQMHTEFKLKSEKAICCSLLYLLHDSNYMTIWKRQNYTDSKKISGRQELGGQGVERKEQVEHRGFWGQ